MKAWSNELDGDRRVSVGFAGDSFYIQVERPVEDGDEEYIKKRGGSFIVDGMLVTRMKVSEDAGLTISYLIEYAYENPLPESDSDE